jgi:hypothetical protein
MADTTVSPNNTKIVYGGGRRGGKVDRERAVPWNAKTIKKHNKSLNKGEAKSAAKQATAILDKTGDEGLALAVANKQVNRLRKAGKISDRQHAKLAAKRERDDGDHEYR